MGFAKGLYRSGPMKMFRAREGVRSERGGQRNQIYIYLLLDHFSHGVSPK